MAIFSSLGIDYRFLIFQSINFLILFLIIYKFFSQPINKVINERKREIEEGFKIRENAEKLIKKIKSLRNKIIQEAEKQKLDILAQAERERIELLSKIKKEIEVKKSEMLKKLNEEEILLKKSLNNRLTKEGRVILLDLAKKIFHHSDLDKEFLKKLFKE